MNICVIPARGGSKRIPRKNIKLFNDKPIIAYSIEAAIKSNCFSQVIVSTDDDEIAKVAKKYGAQVPFVRPKELSNDYITTIPVIKHAIEWMQKKNILFDNVCCLYATAPFISPQIISKSYQQLKESRSDYCFSVTMFPFPIQRSLKLIKDKKVEMLNPKYLDTRSQDLEDTYHDAGQFYWGSAKAFKDEIPIFSEVASAFVLPRYLVQDIDSEEDWVRAEAMYKVLQHSKFI